MAEERSEAELDELYQSYQQQVLDPRGGGSFRFRNQVPNDEATRRLMRTAGFRIKAPEKATSDRDPNA